jgi:4-aminobutyrate aminotransferase/(S)-3-amino-2-methylpropionate transaminase
MLLFHVVFSQVRDRIESQRACGRSIDACIVEPIQAEGGDHYGSANFFRELRDICLDNDIAFIVDEVQTGGGATGRWWAHEAWGLSVPPDLVTFSKKMITGGYFYREEFVVPEVRS